MTVRERESLLGNRCRTRRNIVVIADEAHRSQYDFIDGYARHMRDALPHASFIGFTGTPINRKCSPYPVWSRRVRRKSGQSRGGKPYAKELRALPQTYSFAQTFRIDSLAAALRSVRSLPLVAVGSGGSLTTAHFAAALHREHTGNLAAAMTPMEVVETPLTRRRWPLSYQSRRQAAALNISLPGVARRRPATSSVAGRTR